MFLLFPEGEKKSPFIDSLDLDFWTEFLGDRRLHNYAVQAIERNFRKSDLSKEWIKARLYSKNRNVVQLAQEYIEEGRHEDGVDWFDVYLDNLFGQPGKISLRDWSWEALSKIDSEGNSLLQRFSAQEYRKMLVHSNPKLRKLAIEAMKKSSKPATIGTIGIINLGK